MSNYVVQKQLIRKYLISRSITANTLAPSVIFRILEVPRCQASIFDQNHPNPCKKLQIFRICHHFVKEFCGYRVFVDFEDPGSPEVPSQYFFIKMYDFSKIFMKFLCSWVVLCGVPPDQGFQSPMLQSNKLQCYFFSFPKIPEILKNRPKADFSQPTNFGCFACSPRKNNGCTHQYCPRAAAASNGDA